MTLFNDVMLDLETLGVSPTAPIVSIGAAMFDRVTWEIGPTFHMACSPDLRKYTTDLDTVRFWLRQSEAARGVVVQEGQPLKHVLLAFKEFLGAAHPKAAIWALPVSFDLPILENAYRVEEVHVPWHYAAPRDLRTVFDLAKIEKVDRVQPIVAHDALADCLAQIATLKLAFQCIQKLGLSWT